MHKDDCSIMTAQQDFQTGAVRYGEDTAGHLAAASFHISLWKRQHVAHAMLSIYTRELQLIVSALSVTGKKFAFATTAPCARAEWPCKQRQIVPHDVSAKAGGGMAVIRASKTHAMS